MDNIKRMAISMYFSLFMKYFSVKILRKHQFTKSPFERVLSDMTNEEDFFPNMSRLIELSEHSFNQ